MKLRATLPTLALAIFLSGCVSPTTVDYDREAKAKFGDYRCFTIDSREARSDYQDVVLSPIVDRRIERAIRDELAARGFQGECATPDFRVTFNTVTKTRTEIDDMDGLSPFRRYPYYGYGRGPWLEIDQYEQGTFIIDIVDNESRELVWRGAYTKRLGWSAPTEAEVARIVAEILAEFPPG